jgi:hypothetical protein
MAFLKCFFHLLKGDSKRCKKPDAVDGGSEAPRKAPVQNHIEPKITEDEKFELCKKFENEMHGEGFSLEEHDVFRLMSPKQKETFRALFANYSVTPEWELKFNEEWSQFCMSIEIKLYPFYGRKILVRCSSESLGKM